MYVTHIYITNICMCIHIYTHIYITNICMCVHICVCILISTIKLGLCNLSELSGKCQRRMEISLKT